MAVRSPPLRAAPAQSEKSEPSPHLRDRGPEAGVAAAMEPEAPPNELVSAEGRNRKAVLCQRCGSRVLQPGTALFSRRQVGGPEGGRAGEGEAAGRVPARGVGPRGGSGAGARVCQPLGPRVGL